MLGKSLLNNWLQPLCNELVQEAAKYGVRLMLILLGKDGDLLCVSLLQSVEELLALLTSCLKPVIKLHALSAEDLTQVLCSAVSDLDIFQSLLATDYLPAGDYAERDPVEDGHQHGKAGVDGKSFYRSTHVYCALGCGCRANKGQCEKCTDGAQGGSCASNRSAGSCETHCDRNCK
jgi:hypothetical protein